MPYTEALNKSLNATNNIETNNIKSTNSILSLAAAYDLENTIVQVSNKAFSQTANDKSTTNNIAEQPVEKKERKMVVILGKSIVKRVQERNFVKEGQSKYNC